MSAKTTLETAATATLAICAVAVTLLWARREFIPPPDPMAPREVGNWETFAAEGIRIGPANAPVTIVEFSDFQCPFCRELSSTLAGIREVYPSEVAIVYRHFPLGKHAQALSAAIASECAQEQGRFQAYHDALFAQQDSLAKLDWVSVAARVDVPDTVAFRRCLRSDAVTKRIRADSLAGRRLGLKGTPTVLVNKWRLMTTPGESDLQLLIENELRRLRKQ